MTTPEEAGSTRRRREARELPGWVFAVLGVLLAAIFMIAGATLYLVSELEDQSEQAQETAKTVQATKAAVDLIAARQLESKDIPQQVEAAVNETKELLVETQDAIDETNQAVAATNQTIEETNQLLDEAEAAATKAQQSVANLQQSQQQLASKLDTQLAKIRARLASIESRLEQLGSR